MKLKLESPKVEATVTNGIGWLVFNQPEKRNAVSADMWPSIAQAMKSFGEDEAVRVIVMRGAGEEAFVSGGDISEFEDRMSGSASVERRASFAKAADEGMASLRSTGKPLIAMIHGDCFGGGLLVAQEADMLVASDEARFSIPAARIGVGYPQAAIDRMMALIGPLATADFLFTARVVHASEAQGMGLLNAVVPRQDLESHTVKIAARIAANAPLTVLAAKAAIRASAPVVGSDERARVAAMVAACADSADFLEGTRAFLGKRRPVFTGR